MEKKGDINNEVLEVCGFPAVAYGEAVVCDIRGCIDIAVCHDGTHFLCIKHAQLHRKLYEVIDYLPGYYPF